MLATPDSTKPFDVYAKQNIKKELKEMLNWMSYAENGSTGKTDACSIGASDGCRKFRRPGIGANLSTKWRSSEDQVKIAKSPVEPTASS